MTAPTIPRPTTATWDKIWPTLGEKGLINVHVPACFEVRFDGENWNSFKDRQPFERHNSRNDAVSGVRNAMQRIFAAGEAAQWRLITPAA